MLSVRPCPIVKVSKRECQEVQMRHAAGRPHIVGILIFCCVVGNFIVDSRQGAEGKKQNDMKEKGKR